MFKFKYKEKEKRERRILDMEINTANQIKNTFADVTEIIFSEKCRENKLTGYTLVDVAIYTNYGVSSLIDAAMSMGDLSKTLSSYGVDPKLLEGITLKKIKVIFSNQLETRI